MNYVHDFLAMTKFMLEKLVIGPDMEYSRIKNY